MDKIEYDYEEYCNLKHAAHITAVIENNKLTWKCNVLDDGLFITLTKDMITTNKELEYLKDAEDYVKHSDFDGTLEEYKKAQKRCSINTKKEWIRRSFFRELKKNIEKYVSYSVYEEGENVVVRGTLNILKPKE